MAGHTKKSSVWLLPHASTVTSDGWCPRKRRRRESGRLSLHGTAAISAAQRFVYIIQNENTPKRFYTGLTST
jgi:hypothetical protein